MTYNPANEWTEKGGLIFTTDPEHVDAMPLVREAAAGYKQDPMVMWHLFGKVTCEVDVPIITRKKGWVAGYRPDDAVKVLKAVDRYMADPTYRPVVEAAWKKRQAEVLAASK